MATVAAEHLTGTNKRKAGAISSDSEENCFAGDDADSKPMAIDDPTKDAIPAVAAPPPPPTPPTTTATAVVAPSAAARSTTPTTVSDSATPPDAPMEEILPPREPNEYDKLRWVVIQNDGSEASLIKLVGLKSLFAKQLPKMPRSYIARLVFDRSHTSLAILSDLPTVKDTDDEIIGAICYRPVFEQRFAEIAFCAVNANYQVKGYGTKLMNLLKQQAIRDGIEYFITYADDYAIGYFKKQGFTKTITMPKGRYYRYIKEYDGATPMECYIHPSIDFTRIDEMVTAQRQFILQRVARKAQSPHNMYTPVTAPGTRPADLLALPGVAAAGWTLHDMVKELQQPGGSGSGGGGPYNRAALRQECMDLLRKVCEQQYAWPFREPVDTKEVPDYRDVIHHPMDLKTIEKKIQKDAYKTKQLMFNDLILMVDNCKLYNEDGSPYIDCAVKVEKFVKNLFKDGA